MTKPETKRDVFEEISMGYWSYLGNAIAQNGGIHAEFDATKRTDAYRARYDAALPDDLPVLPRTVSSAIESAKQYHHDLLWIFNEASARYPDFGDRTSRWILEHQNIFARAWLLETWLVGETGEVEQL